MGEIHISLFPSPPFSPPPPSLVQQDNFLLKTIHTKERGDEMKIWKIKYKIVNTLIMGGDLGVLILQRCFSILHYFFLTESY